MKIAYKHVNIHTQAIKKDFADLSGAITETINSTPSPSPREFVCCLLSAVCCLSLSAVCCLLSAACCLLSFCLRCHHGNHEEHAKNLLKLLLPLVNYLLSVFCCCWLLAFGCRCRNFVNFSGKLDDHFELEPSSPMDPPFGTYAPTVSSSARAAVDSVPLRVTLCSLS
jgi:hypothetical protein